MMKPPFRERDEIPKRQDDIRFSFLGATVEASGRTVVIVIVAVILGLLGAAGYFATATAQELHDRLTSEQHSRLIETVEIMTCVLTLNEAERKDFRTTGAYCGGYNASKNIRRHMLPDSP